MFTEHTIESAPAAARRSMTATISHNGYLPTAVGLMATSPELLDGFLKMSAAFEGTTLDPLARETLIMTMATRNGCHLCVAMHTARLAKLGADDALVAALRTGSALADERLDAIRVFTLRVLDTTGAVGDDALKAFLGHGLHRAERARGGARHRRLHHVDPGQPAHRRPHRRAPAVSSPDPATG